MNFRVFFGGVCPVVLAIFLVQPEDSPANPGDSVGDHQECLLKLVKTAPDHLTIGDLREQCQEPTPSLAENSGDEVNENSSGIVEERLSVDATNILKPFTIMSHRKNYLLVAAHNFQGWDPSRYEQAYEFDDLDVDDTEAQFQLSVKTPLAVDLFDKNIDLFAGYTVRSFWQVYNSDYSSPFRETNHEPEIWMQVRPSWQILGFKNTVNAIGFNHMSNGQGGSLSRSWNRVFGAFAFERGNFAILLSPWIRIEEDIEDDDNPDITDYYGHGDLRLGYKYKNHTFSLMTRNNLESGFSRGAVELGWSFPLFKYPFLKGYLHYFSGYGESLIDYDRYANTLGVGLLFTDIF